MTEPIMPPGSFFYPRIPTLNNRTFLNGGVALLVFIVALTALVTLTQLRQQAEMRATSMAQNLSKLIEQSLDGLIDTIDIALLASANEITRQIKFGRLDRHAINRMLAHQRHHIPRVASFSVIDANGSVNYGTSTRLPPINNADRDFFIRLRDNAKAGLAISKPYIGRISGKWVWAFARRIQKQDGSFGGVVYAVIMLDEIEKIFAQVRIGKANSISLRAADLTLLARYPAASAANFPIGEKRSSPLFLESFAANPQEGTYISDNASVDGIGRTHAYQRSEKYGFVANVGISHDFALSDWRKQAWIVGGLVVSFVLALLVFAGLMRRAWQRQEEAVTSLQEAQQIAHLGRYTYNFRTDCWTSSDIFDEIFGIDKYYTRDAKHWEALVSPASREERQAHLNTLMEQCVPLDIEYRIVRPCDAEERWVSSKGKLQLDDDGIPLTLIGTIQDITERKHAEYRINELAFFDQLTGLANRTLLLDRLKRVMTANARSGAYGALLLIDLDNFKTLNDTLGHEMGDLLLKQVAQSLSSCVRSGDTVARLGGDEFVVMLVGLSMDEREAASQTEFVGEKILVALNKTYHLKEISYHGTQSIGVSLFCDQHTEINVLLKQADLAMYRAKDAGRNRLRFFDPAMEHVVLQRVALERDLRAAIHENQLLLHYQPQVASGFLTGAEALVRWQHPQRGLVLPSEFIPLAEETGLILPLGYWVLETACAQLTAWASRPDMAHLTIAVNVSAHQFRQTDFVEQVLKVLKQTGACPERLKIELTESMLVSNVEELIDKMFSLKAKGVGFSLDDFGTGYSSLAYLKRLPLDQLKIDRSFVRDVLSDPNDASIAKTIITLAQSLGLGVIAEGVETALQRDFLANSGCYAYQGYFFSRPLAIDDFEKYCEWN